MTRVRAAILRAVTLRVQNTRLSQQQCLDRVARGRAAEAAMRIARVVLMVAIAAGFGVAILSHEEPGVMTVGLAPLAWLALEGIWCLLDPTT